jgi:ABC-type nitrate/sulfonate/bicarbonate transport system substrate-binding protein
MHAVRQVLFVPPAPVVWAQALGLFVAEGVELETTQTTSSDEIGRGLAQGRWDIGIGVMDNVIAWNAMFGADLRIAAQLERRMELRFVSRQEDHSMADAARHQIAVDATSNGFVLVLYRALARAGIDWRSCRLQEVGGVRQRFEALQSGRARSSILIPPFDEMLRDKGFKVLWSVGEVAPDYPGVVVALRGAFVEERRDAALAYLRALLEANRRAGDPAHREEAIAALTATRYSPQAAAMLIDDAVGDLRPSSAGWEETMRLRRECGLQPEPQPRVWQTIDSELWSEALRAAPRQ